jgi:predicted lipoprotein with Yx(FWY)xxD motif
MRALASLLTSSVVLSGIASIAVSGEPTMFDHPGEIALHESSPGKWEYNDEDPPGKSTCYLGCAAAWPPVRARPDAQPVGHWTIIVRDDGKRQWAYKGKPVYVRFHDQVANPLGHDEEGKWRVLEP